MNKKLFSAGIFSGVAILLSPQMASAHVYTLQMFDVDDVETAYITNVEYSDKLLFAEPFGDLYNPVDISAFVTSGLNDIKLTLFNGPAGYAYGYDFKIDGVTYQSGQCGIFNTYGCNADSYAKGIVWTTDIEFAGTSSNSIASVPEPMTWSLMLLGFLGAGAAVRRSRTAPAVN